MLKRGLGKFGCLLLLWGWGSALFAAPVQQSAVAEGVVGRAEMSRTTTEKWKAIKTGSKIRHRDQLRTFAGAQLEVRMPNGSQLVIQENGLVDMSELLEENGHVKNSVQIRKGKVLFSIKKLTTAQSSFTFETPTATAAIRGTEGGIALLSGAVAAFLQSGRIELSDKSSNGVALIGTNNLVVQGGSSAGLYQLPSDFDPQDLINRLNDDDLADLLSQLTKTPITPWVIESPAAGSAVVGSFTLSGFGIPGTTVDAGEATALVDSAGLWSMPFSARTEEGPFALKMRLVAGSDQTVLEWPLVASEMPDTVAAAIELESPTSVAITDGVLNVAGKVSGKNGELLLQIGQTTRAIPVVDGRFSTQIEVSDAARNWEATEALLNWTTGNGTARAVIALSVDPTSPRVNTLSPELFLDEVNGKLRLGVQRMEGDRATVELFADGEEVAHFELSGNLSGRQVPMVVGIHDYKMVVIDQAGNRAEKLLTAKEYWPRTTLRVEVNSSARMTSARVPPLPPGSDQNQFIPVSIRIHNLPGDDPRALKEIEITNAAVNFRRVISGVQLDDIFFGVDVPIRRMGSNRIVVKVEPKNGLTAVGQKNIELRR